MFPARCRTALSWALFLVSAILFLDCGRQCIVLGLFQIQKAAADSHVERIATGLLECHRNVNASDASISQSLELIAIANSSQYKDTKQAPEVQLSLCQSGMTTAKGRAKTCEQGKITT
jgi:hypothetical protein